MSSRHYLFPATGEPLRISQRIVDGLLAGTDALPQYAGTQQRLLSVFLDLEDGKPLRIYLAQGSIWYFDADGGIQDGLDESLTLIMRNMVFEKPTGSVVELRPKLDKRKLDTKFRWEPSQAELDRVVADIWPKKKIDRLAQVQSVSKRIPPLTFEARKAIEEAAKHFWHIAADIEQLKRTSLLSFAAEARQRCRNDPDYPELYRSLAELSEFQLQLLSRRKTGKGVWYALVEIVFHDAEHRTIEAVERHYARCKGKKEAVKVTGQMLAHLAPRFAEGISVEPEFITDLEWQRRDLDGHEINRQWPPALPSKA